MVKIKDFSRPLSTFQGKLNFQGLFKTVVFIQALFKPVQTLNMSGMSVGCPHSGNI